MRRIGLLVVAMLLLGDPAEAKFDPLKIITESQLRADILIVVSTSGSMSSGVSGDGSSAPACTNVSGSDCYGDRSGTVDICGDGMCTGLESSSSCAADCTLTDNVSPLVLNDAPAGQAPSCSANFVSRFAMSKRALRNILPKLRTVANFGLIGFEQHGYYTYYQGTANLPPSSVSVFLSEWEMKRIGAWIGGSDEPADGFVWPAPTGTGETLTLISNSALAVAADSLYRRVDDPSVEMRFAWATAGKRYDDGTHQWAYAGSYYTYTQSAIATDAPTQTFAKYHGPQFRDGVTTWVHQRYANTTCTNSEQGIDGNFLGASLVEGLSESTAQSDYDAALGRVLAHLNTGPNGGLMGVGVTPLGPALRVALNHFSDRKQGTGSFGAADNAAACRPRSVVVISDGSTFDGEAPAGVAADLTAVDPGNPIKTYVIALPGANMATLNAVAAAGGTSAAHQVNNETELLSALDDALLAPLEGTFATSAAGVATTAKSTIEGNIGLIVATDFPSWKGHLRAVDVTTKCGGPTPPPNFPCPAGSTCIDGLCQMWDAGTVLETRGWESRRLYTGLASLAGGTAIPMMSFDATGAVCVTAGSHPDCSAVTGIRDVWIATGGGAPPADLDAMVRWLAGKDRAWKLGPIINSVPAGVGPPPRYGATVPGHDELEQREAQRQRIVYVTSTEGLLHAFDLQTGGELFAFLPGHLLHKAYELYKQGGQDVDPDNFKWVLANSPRVEDLKDAAGFWQTYLVQTDGPGGENFAVLDITDPSSCANPLDSSTCAVNTPPVTVVFSSITAAPSIDATFGETWSVPALFWDAADMPRAAMGSGYDITVGEGSFYNFFKTIAQPGWATSNPADLETQFLDGTTALVNDYAVLADTAAAVDFDGGRRVIATYQADLAGRIVRFDGGNAGLAATVLDGTDQAGSGQPFYFSPAVLYRDDLNKVTVAAASGAFQEADTSWNPNFESSLFMRAEQGGSVDAAVDNLTCPISQLCDPACFGGGVPVSCISPSSKALPTSSPLLLRNALAGDRIEAFYVYHDPPVATCSGNDVAVGDAIVIRVASEQVGGPTELVATKRYSDSHVTGLSIVGGGSDLVLMKTERGGARASIETISGNPVTSAGLTGRPVVESWREVR